MSTPAWTETSDSAFFLWQPPGKGISVHLSLAVVQRLALDAAEALASIPKRGLEIGGFLLGRSAVEAGNAEFWVEGFEPLESEHRFGPSYELSDDDRQRLAGGVAKWKARAGEQVSLIGFFRTHTRPGLSLGKDDIAVMECHFAQPPGIFLLVKPAAEKQATAGFFFWEGNRIQAEAPLLEFPFQLDALAPETPAAEGEAAPASAVAGAHIMRHLGVVAGVAALAVAGGIAWYQRRPAPARAPLHTAGTAAKPHWLSLGLRREGDALRLHWDRTAPRIQTARSGALWITDGEHQEVLNLDAGQLRTGSILYWPSSADVNFRLDVTGGEGGTSESIRAISVPHSAPTAAGPAAVVKITSRKPERAAQGARKPLARAAAPGESARRTPPPLLESPPELAPAPAGNDRSLCIPSSSAPAPCSTVTVEPVQVSGLGRIVGKIPLVRRLRPKRDSAFEAAKPIKQPIAEVPAELRRELNGEVPIDVKVYIDNSGKVEYAELLSDATARNNNLASLAVFTARRWEFEPARADGRPVPSQMILHYRFR